MGDRVAYVIASYAGQNRNQPYGADVLHVQIEQLCKWLQAKRDLDLEKLISTVCIVVPEIAMDARWDGYYQFDKWRAMLAAFDVELARLSYVGRNLHWSYDQWIQGCLAVDAEYYLVIEDDYCLDVANPAFDHELVALYKEKFPDGLGYLATYVDCVKQGWDNYRHAAISNGLISRATWRSIEDPLGRFYADQTFPRHLVQCTFSKLFPALEDIATTHRTLFWDSDVAVAYGHPEGKPSFLPVQYVLSI